MKKFLFAVWAIFLGIVTGNAQGNKELTGEIREAIDYAFENVDLQKVPTGILSDYGIETIPLATYNGAKNNKAVMIPGNFPSFYQGLYSCMVNKRKVYQSIWIEQTLSLIGW